MTISPSPSTAQRIEQKITDGLHPRRLLVRDDSHQHAGHAGARPGGESHFYVEVVADAFAGLGRVARQRLIHEVLADELAGGVHALQLRTLAPSED